MPQFTFKQALTANGTYEPLTGWQYEYLPFPAIVEIATNASDANVVETITSGSDTLVEESPTPGGGTAGTLPDADKPTIQDIAAAGDRLKIRFRETAGGTPTAQGWIRITQLG
jgi:hypothetical protein